MTSGGLGFSVYVENNLETLEGFILKRYITRFKIKEN